LERNHVVEEHGRQRHDRQEDHGRAVHREQLVVRVRRQECVLRAAELNSQQQRLDPAHQEEEESGGAVENPDPLVIDRGNPAPKAGLLAVRRCVSRMLI
jgi:hypothetical protein